MKQTKIFCKKCGSEITECKGKTCPNCGAKITKPIYKKWWFWVLIVVGVSLVFSAAGGDNSDANNSENETSSISTPDNSQQGSNQSGAKTYTVVDLQKMLDDLASNAMRAEATYQNMYVEITGKIANIDSDGSYITIESVNADEWNFDTVMCYIKNDTQRNVIMEKEIGDTVTIKGKIISIGEVLGYSVNIDEIN